MRIYAVLKNRHVLHTYESCKLITGNRQPAKKRETLPSHIRGIRAEKCLRMINLQDLTKINFFEWPPLTDILSDIYSDSLSGIAFDLLYGIWYDIHESLYSIWHSIWHFTWHMFWQAFARAQACTAKGSLRYGSGPMVPTLTSWHRDQENELHLCQNLETLTWQVGKKNGNTYLTQMLWMPRISYPPYDLLSCLFCVSSWVNLLQRAFKKGHSWRSKAACFFKSCHEKVQHHRQKAKAAFLLHYHIF